jgi:hypothetical protein
METFQLLLYQHSFTNSPIHYSVLTLNMKMGEQEQENPKCAFGFVIFFFIFWVNEFICLYATF